MDLFDRGSVREGAQLFYVVLDLASAPVAQRCRRDGSSPWDMGSARQQYTFDVLRACVKGELLFVLEDDGPARSVVGTVMQEAWDRGIRNFGGLGIRRGQFKLELSPALTEAFKQSDLTGALARKTIGQRSFLIDSLEVSRFYAD